MYHLKAYLKYKPPHGRAWIHILNYYYYCLSLLPVDPPELDVTGSLDSGRPGSAVYESQLSEAAALTDTQHLLPANVDLDLALGGGGG